MKRLIITLILSISFITLWGQINAYQVYSIEKEVEIKKGNKWEKLKKGGQLSIKDVVKIGYNSELRIIELKVNQVYTINREGTKSVFNLIRQAKRDNDKIISSVNNYTQKKIKENVKIEVSYSTIGGAYRGDEDLESINDSIYSSIIKILGSTTQNSSQDLTLSLISKKTGVPLTCKEKKTETEFYFRIENKSNNILYTNILSISETQKPTICIDIDYSNNASCIVIAKNSILNLDGLSFVYDKTVKSYFLFSSPVPFDSKSLDKMLEYNMKPTAGEGIVLKTYKLNP